MKKILLAVILLSSLSCKRMMDDPDTTVKPPSFDDGASAYMPDCIRIDSAYTTASADCSNPPFNSEDSCYKIKVAYKSHGLWGAMHWEAVRFSQLNQLSEVYSNPSGFLLNKLGQTSCKP